MKEPRTSREGVRSGFNGKATLRNGDTIKTSQTKGRWEMRRGKFRFLLVALLVASNLLFAGGESRAATFTYTLTTNPSPIDPSTTRTYEFYFKPGTGTLAIGNIDLEIPANLNLPVGLFPSTASNGRFTVGIKNGQTLSGEVYGTGIGDYGTKFGVGDMRYRVMKVNTPSLSIEFTLVLTISVTALDPGTTLASEKGAVLIKAGNGSNTQSFYPADTPAIVTYNGPTISNISIFPNPTQPPQCATVTWSGTDIVSAVVNVTPPPPATDCVINPNPGTSSAFLCFVDQGNYSVTVLATGSNGGTSSRSTTLTVNPPPLIETTCKQIRKNPVEGTPSCIYLCLNTIDGMRQDIQSATWFNNANCDPAVSEGIPLTIYGIDSPEQTLVCAPCIFEGGSHPQACTTNENPNITPFHLEQGLSGNTHKNCDVFRYEHQDQGFAAVLGNDPWVVINGRQVWVK